MTRQVMLAVGLVFAAGCGSPPGEGPASSSDAHGVCEAALRHQLQRLPGGAKPADVKVFISVDGNDPPPELLARLRKDWPLLKPASEGAQGREMHVYVRDLRWDEHGKAEITAGYSFSHAGYFADHHVVREKGTWVVAKVSNETIS